MTALGDLRTLAETFALGGLVNAADVIGKSHGSAELPPAVYVMCEAITSLLRELGLDQADERTRAEVWRSTP